MHNPPPGGSTAPAATKGNCRACFRRADSTDCRADSIDRKPYRADGTEVHKQFSRKAVSGTERVYEAWFDTDEEHYIVEDPLPHSGTRYENTGIHMNDRERCRDGGTIINYWIPKTHDNTILPLWIILTVFGLAGTGSAVLRIRRGKKR